MLAIRKAASLDQVVTYSDYVLAVPSGLRLLIALVVVVGITLLCLKIFYPQIIALQQVPKKDEDAEDEPFVPEVYHLSGRIISITTTAFVFLSAFALNNFWGATKAADAAVQSETRAYYSAVSAVNLLKDEASREAALAAFSDYSATLRDVESPLLQQADVAAAYRVQLDASLKLGEAIASAHELDASGSATWDRVNDYVTDTTNYGEERVRALPGTGATSLIWLIIFLGLANLALLTAFQPTFFRRNAFLVATAAFITTVLLFVVIEVSNPFIGNAAVQSGLASATCTDTSAAASCP